MLNYPAGINNKKKTIQFKNRGMSLESLLNETNEFYLLNNKAVIYKKPTPIKVIKMDATKKRITSAIFDKHSTTDYNGVFNGIYIDYEAKSTKNKTSFPLSNFQTCQINHFRKILMQKACAFVIIEFSRLEKYYLLPANKLIEFIDNNKRKSIELSYIEKNGFEILRTINPTLDYLKIISSFYKKNKTL